MRSYVTMRESVFRKWNDEHPGVPPQALVDAWEEFYSDHEGVFAVPHQTTLRGPDGDDDGWVTFVIDSDNAGKGKSIFYPKDTEGNVDKALMDWVRRIQRARRRNKHKKPKLIGIGQALAA